MFRHNILFSLLALSLCCAQLPAQAMAIESVFAIGIQYFEQGRFDEAYEELYQAFRQDPANLDLNFYLGRAAFESGRYEEAVMAFERILLADPGADRVKLELARAHLQLGSREIAKQYFKEVLATNPSEQVRKNIQHFLDAIAASEKKHFVNGSLTLGHAWDDNARSAPVSNKLSLGIFELTLTGPTATPQRDQINNTTLVLNHRYNNEENPVGWKTSATSYNALYQKLYDLNINYLGLSTGPLFQRESFLWDTQLLGSHIDVGHDRYQSSVGGSTSFTAFLAQNFLATWGVKIEEKNNYVDPDRDATNLLYPLGLVGLAGFNRLSLNFAKEVEIASDETNSYDRVGVKLRYDRELPADIALFAGIGLTKTDYDKKHPFFNVLRSDDVQELVAGVSRILWKDLAQGQGLVAQLGHTYTDASSSISLYTYRKNVTEFSLTVTF